MTNPWLAHVRKTMGEHPGKTFTYILKRANRTYKKGGKKGAKKRRERKIKVEKQKENEKIRKNQLETELLRFIRIVFVSNNPFFLSNVIFLSNSFLFSMKESVNCSKVFILLIFF